MLRQILLPCTLFAFLPFFATFSRAADWNQWRGPNRDGAAPASPALIDGLPETGLKPIWVSKEDIPSGGGGGWSSPIVADGKVYMFTHQKSKLKDIGEKKYPWLPPEKRVGMTDEEYQEYEVKRRDEDEQRAAAFKFEEVLYCLDDATGETLWKNTRSSVYTRFPQSGCPAVIDGRVYLLGAGLVARCVDAATGETIWNQTLPGEFRDEYVQSSFSVVDGVAVVLGRGLYGLNAKTGEILWQQEANEKDSSPVLWSDGETSIVIANVGGDNTAAFEPKTGKEIWRVKSEAGRSTPVIVGNRMLTYGSSRKKGLRCFEISLSDAKEVWKYHGVADSGSSPVVVGDHVFVQGERKLACVDLASGQQRWITTMDISNPRYSSLAAADGKVFYAFDNLLCYSADYTQCQQLVNAKIDTDGNLVEEAAIRKVLNLDELEKTVEGQKQAARLLREKFGKNGVLSCTSPAIVDGRLYLRLKSNVACYDLTAN